MGELHLCCSTCVMLAVTEVLTAEEMSTTGSQHVYSFLKYLIGIGFTQPNQISQIREPEMHP